MKLVAREAARPDQRECGEGSGRKISIDTTEVKKPSNDVTVLKHPAINENHQVETETVALGDVAASQQSNLVDVSMQSVYNEPIGMSFDSSDTSINTSNDSSDFQIAGGCDSARNIMEALLPNASDLEGGKGEANKSKSLDVFEFTDNEESDMSSIVDPDDYKSQKCCNNLCTNQKIGLRVHTKLSEIREHDKGDWKQMLLDHLIKQEEMGLPTHGFQLYGQFFCKKSFVQISGVSEYIINEALKAFEFGQTSFIHGNEVGMRETDATFGFEIWMKLHAENYGNQAPDESTIVLPACFSQKDLFKHYQEEAPQPQIKSSTFYRLFKLKFGPHRLNKGLPHIRISSYSTHSKCDQCILLEKYQRTCKGEQNLQFAKSLKQSHKQTYQRAYQAIQERRHKALYDPENHIFIQGMESSLN